MVEFYRCVTRTCVDACFRDYNFTASNVRAGRRRLNYTDQYYSTRKLGQNGLIGIFSNKNFTDHYQFYDVQK